MNHSRRSFVKAAAAATLGSAVQPLIASRADQHGAVNRTELDRIVDAPVLDLSFVKEPVIVESIELLRNGGVFLLRTRSRSGVEVLTVPNPARMAQTFPVFLQNILPVFLGKDARDLESLLWDVYRHGSNYKLQGLALWPGVAAIEMALLELMGRATSRPLADFFGGAVRRDIPVYYASSNRGNGPGAEIEHLQKLVAGSGVRALKFRLGGRMSRNQDHPPGRTEALIPLVRETFGSDFTLYGDANSSYDVENGIRIGRMMEEHGYAFFEEPCPFDHLWETKEVADALAIPVAGGEQEYSMRRFQWTIEHRGVDIAQPDLHYGGGLIRATKVARMAAAAGMTVVPHMSGGGLGHLDVVHYASFTPNTGPFMEFKGNARFPVSCDSSSLQCENGVVRCPTGAGWGVEIDADFVRQAEAVTLS